MRSAIRVCHGLFGGGTGAILDEADQSNPWQVNQLLQILSLYEDMVGVPTPEHGTLGKRYNHTTLGIHTDAILKINLMVEKATQEHKEYMARRLQKMARTIYSAVDPLAVGGTKSRQGFPERSQCHRVNRQR